MRKKQKRRISSYENYLRNDYGSKPSSADMTESTRKRWFKLFPNAEKRYLEYERNKKNKAN
tara:strand:+ start:738 stop:920 length:183 start_codon:yes stop_codon:yes gene_type:complete